MVNDRENKDNNNENKSKEYRNYLEYSSIGFTLVFSTFLGLVGGIFLDKKLNTIPLFTIVFLILGIVIGFVNIFRVVNRLDKNKK